MPHVLFLDDNDDIRSVFSLIIQDAGYDVLAFASPAAARRDPTIWRCDVAVLDVSMPDETGDAFALELRRFRPELKIIFITGEHDLAKLKARVPKAYVMTKPLDVDVLLTLLSCG